MAKVQFRWGFKTEGHALAREFREELGLAPHDPLCPWRLAEHLAVPLFRLTEFVAEDNVAYLTTARGQEEFSATVCYDGCAAFVIYNNTHAPVRQASNIAHELAHIVLRHPPLPLIKADGSRAYDKALEDEASWLGPALLVSEEAALHIVEQGWSAAAAGRVYGVSASLISMRVQVTGAKTRVARRRVA